MSPRAAAALGLLAAAVGAVPAVAADTALVATSPSASNAALLAVASDGTTRTLVSGPPFEAPTGVAALTADRTLVADQGRGQPGALWRVDAAAGTVVRVDVAGTLERPRAVAVGSDGTYLVADEGGHGQGATGAVRRVDPVSGAVTTIAASAVLVEPDGIAVEPSGSLLVSDAAGAGTGALWRVSPDTGQVALVSDDPLIAGARGVAVTPLGVLVAVPRSGGGAIVRVDTANGVATDLVSGPPLVTPAGIAVQRSGRVLVLDSGGQALRAFGPAELTLTDLATFPAFTDGAAVGAAVTSDEPPAAPEPAATPVATSTPVPIPLPVPVDLSAVRLSPSSFKVARRGALISVVRGARMTFTLSAPGRVRFTVHVCRSRGARRRCIRDRRLSGKVFVTGTAGLNVRRFSGRLAGRALPPGDYRLYAKAEQPDGTFADSKQVLFRILP